MSAGPQKEFRWQGRLAPNQTIESDWPLAQKAHNLGQSAQGVIGGGQFNLQLNAAAGNIQLRRAQHR